MSSSAFGHFQPFSVQKAGGSVEENDDAGSPSGERDLEASPFRCAIADGATESSFSGLWAKLLVRAFVRGGLSDPANSDELQLLQEQWSNLVHRRPLPWFAETKLKDGAFAAFVGLTLGARNASEEGTWECVAAGDSCLAHVRDDQLLQCLPIASPQDFSNRPHLISSLINRNGALKENVHRASGSWCQDDSFFLMTDALACWFLAQSLAGGKPWRVLLDLETESSTPFSEFVDQQRDSGQMKNDDVTLLRVDVW